MQSFSLGRSPRFTDSRGEISGAESFFKHTLLTAAVSTFPTLIMKTQAL
jgi:hypothetical protein